MLGEFYQSQPPWLSSQDSKLGVTVLTAAKEKPWLPLTALCRGSLCCLSPDSSWQGAHPDSTEGRQQCVPSLNVEGHSLGTSRAETKQLKSYLLDVAQYVEKSSMEEGILVSGFSFTFCCQQPYLLFAVESALKLPFGKTTVMHLVARETLPEPNSQ
ncbi:hypothetical protein A6R68_14092, partial [Neotoma lepida]